MIYPGLHLLPLFIGAGVGISRAMPRDVRRLVNVTILGNVGRYAVDVGARHPWPVRTDPR